MMAGETFEVLEFDIAKPKWRLVMLPAFEDKHVDALGEDAVRAIAGDADSG